MGARKEEGVGIVEEGGDVGTMPRLWTQIGHDQDTTYKKNLSAGKIVPKMKICVSVRN